MRNWHGNLSPFGKRHTAGGRVSPLSRVLSALLADATQLIVHPLEDGSMFQARARTTPVTAPGQLVGLVLDHGLTGKAPVLGPELVTNGGPFVDTASWTANNAALSVVNGNLRVTGTGGTFARAAATVSGLVVGRAYEISVTLASSSNSSVVGSSFWFNTGVTPSQRTSISGVNTTIKSLVTATATSSTVNIYATLNAEGLNEFAEWSNVSVRELPGYHATAISDAARGVFAVVPETGRRNLLTRTEEFDNAVWVKEGSTVTVTPNDAVAPNGTTTAARVVFSEANLQILQSITGISAAYSGSVYIKGTAGQTVRVSALAGTVNDFTLTGDWDRVTSTSPATTAPRLSISTFGDVTARDILIWGAQLEVGSTATAYQRVGSEYDVTEAGVPSLHYVAYNGVNTAYATPALPAPGVDKAQVFAGVRKLSEALGIVVELSSNVGGDSGALNLVSRSGAELSFVSRGSVLGQILVGGFLAPTTNILTGIGDISGDVAALRVDGVEVGASTADQGAGNYNPSGTYPLYYGARAGTSLFFNGRHYATLGPIVRLSAANATEEQIEAAEAYYTARVI